MQRDANRIEREYRVMLGHSSVKVRGRTVQEALRAARDRLCRELPRLWDVIQTLDDASFRVRQLDSRG